MSKFYAVKSFAGLVCAGAGDVVEIADKAVSDDLLSAGYIKPVRKTSRVKSNVNKGSDSRKRS